MSSQLVDANDIQICYETFGDPADPALLLVSGFTSQMTGWEEGLCQAFAAAGRYVIRFDNRDVGLSTHFDGQRAMLGEISQARKNGSPPPAVPYGMSDFAADGMGLLSALGIERAHIAGVSMGGFIVQTTAIEHPDRVLTMTSIMSTTGERDYGRATKEANEALMRPPARDRARYIEIAAEDRRIWSSERYFDLEWEKFRLARDYDRVFYPEGSSRQMAAVMTAPDRADRLRSLDVPTLVIHGRHDSLIGLSGGERTAELVPGSTLLVYNDMAHDLPRPLWPQYVDDMISFQNRHA